VKKRGDLGNV
jgi:hypothetical protein